MKQQFATLFLALASGASVFGSLPAPDADIFGEKVIIFSPEDNPADIAMRISEVNVSGKK